MDGQAVALVYIPTPRVSSVSLEAFLTVVYEKREAAVTDEVDLKKVARQGRRKDEQGYMQEGCLAGYICTLGV